MRNDTLIDLLISYVFLSTTNWLKNLSDELDDSLFFFFFQAEDGIRDLTVTGIQTCALPILAPIAAEFGKTLPAMALTITASLATRWVGAILFGLLADRYGRRIPLIANILDRKSTRLNSSHSQISYAVFCLKKKIQNNDNRRT